MEGRLTFCASDDSRRARRQRACCVKPISGLMAPSDCTAILSAMLSVPVVDTGSPFLTVAGSCTTRWGCFQAWLHGEPTLYSDTIEVYGNVSHYIRSKQQQYIQVSSSLSAAASSSSSSSSHPHIGYRRRFWWYW